MLLEKIERVHSFISPDFVKVLSEHGIKTVSDFVRVDPEKVVEISKDCKCEEKDNLNIGFVFKFRKFLLTSYASYSSQSWYSTNSIKSNIIRTGIKEFDEIFKYGFRGGFIYEVYGMPGSGRTQLCLYLVATNALKGGNTLYVDTKNDFCVDRFCEILTSNLEPRNEAKRVKLNCDVNEELVESYLNRVRLSKIYSIQSLLNSLSNVIKNCNDLTCENSMTSETWKFYRNVKLLVIDNIASLVLPLLGDSQYPMSDITAFTSEVIDKMREVAVQHNVIVLVVNNIVVNSSAYSRNFKDSKLNRSANEPSYKPSLGKLFCEAANVRFRISYLNSNENEPKLLYRNSTVFREVSLEKDDSKIASNKKSKCVIKITTNGLEGTTR